MIPSLTMEIPFCGLYFPPLVPIVSGGLVAAAITARFLKKFNLMGRFWHPVLAVTAMAAGYSSLLALITTP